MTTAEQLAQTAARINNAILQAEPDNIAALDNIVTPFMLLGMRYKIKFAMYFGTIQGADVYLYFGGKRKKINPTNIRYGIFS